MLMRELPSGVAAGERPARDLALALLRLASRALDDLATSLADVEEPRNTEAVIEFHAEAGAPEGALYVDGYLVGHVLGVTRL